MEYREFRVLQPNPKHLARCLQPYIVNEIVISDSLFLVIDKLRWNLLLLLYMLLIAFRKFLCKLLQCRITLLYIPWLALIFYFELALSYRLISWDEKGRWHRSSIESPVAINCKDMKDSLYLPPELNWTELNILKGTCSNSLRCQVYSTELNRLISWAKKGRWHRSFRVTITCCYPLQGHERFCCTCHLSWTELNFWNSAFLTGCFMQPALIPIPNERL